MAAKERQNKILEILYQNKTIKISEIVRMFTVSSETARRDLESIQDLGIAKRIHGGAVLLEDSGWMGEPLSNDGETRWEKQHGRIERDAIGKKAAEFIHEGESVCLDVGTTVHEISKHMTGMKNVTVVTNSIAVMNELANSDVSLYILGGHFDADERELKGMLPEYTLQFFYVDKAFIGAGGVTFDGGITDFDLQSATLKKKICEHANKVYLVANSEKFGVNAFSYSCPLSEVDIIITDPMLPKDYADRIREMGIKLMYADLPPMNEA